MQLSDILLAGIGIVFLDWPRAAGALLLFPEERRGWVSRQAGRGIVAGLYVVALIVVLRRADDLDTYDAHSATSIGLQAQAGAQQEPEIDRLLEYMRAHPKGRVYARAPTNWGEDFVVRAVPMFKYLDKDIDEVDLLRGVARDGSRVLPTRRTRNDYRCSASAT